MSVGSLDTRRAECYEIHTIIKVIRLDAYPAHIAMPISVLTFD